MTHEQAKEFYLNAKQMDKVRIVRNPGDDGYPSMLGLTMGDPLRRMALCMTTGMLCLIMHISLQSTIATYYSHCSPLRKAKPTGILHFAKGKTDCGRPNKNIPFS